MAEAQLAALTDEVTHLQDALRDTTAKVAALEAARDADARSYLKRFTIAGTTLALLLSVVTGLYTVYDRLVVKPADLVRAKQDELREVADNLNKLQDDFVFRVTPLTDPLQREQAMRLINVRSEILLQKGRTLTAELGDGAGLAELLVLGYYEMNRGNLQGAKSFLDIAFRKEAVSEVTRGEIFATLGTLYMQPGPQQDLTKGREYFRQGYDALSVRNDPTLVYSRGQLKAQWGLWEIAVGTGREAGCALIAEAKGEILTLPAMALQNVQHSLRTIEAQALQAGCPPP